MDLLKKWLHRRDLQKDELIELNKELIKRMPFLLPKNRITEKPIVGYNYTFTELDLTETPKAWDYLL